MNFRGFTLNLAGIADDISRVLKSLCEQSRVIKDDFGIYTNDSNVIKNRIKSLEDYIDDYSETEFATNKQWIDGRKIYRKVINFGALPNATTKSVAHGITFGANTRILTKDGYCTDGTTIYSLFRPQGSTILHHVFSDNTNITIGANYNAATLTECNVILEYVY